MKQLYFRLTSTVAPYSLYSLVVLYSVGILGLLSPYHEYFKLLTPVNLLLSVFLLVINNRDSYLPLALFILFTFFFGFVIEFLGVRYGILFGSYSYGETLGPKLFNVPIIIGVNWIMIIYSIAILTDSLKVQVWIKILLGAALAVATDWVIEPVAIRYDFWAWADGYVPVQNFIGWFFTSVILLTVYQVLRVKSENPIALPFFFIQLVFFVVLSIGMR
ncbi:MAG: carotenoid biosynthesis protein [Cyclobacteriaceae bacterium]|nr:carotenoid biosynthesis protein [Cyclobacteriaceae bacterium]